MIGNTCNGEKAFTNVDNNQLAYNCWDAGENTCIGVCGLRCEIMNDGEHLQQHKGFCSRYFRFAQRAKNESDAEPGYPFGAGWTQKYWCRVPVPGKNGQQVVSDPVSRVVQ